MIMIQNELNEKAYGCQVGLLAISNVENPRSSDALDKVKCLLEEGIREKYAQMDRQELKQIHPMAA
ncbi:MAG: hypothetical protein PHG70_10065, partial [Synergistaceae bacterium]|nr:hypothetical protein [Synergistaceae bacterium]